MKEMDLTLAGTFTRSAPKTNAATVRLDTTQYSLIHSLLNSHSARSAATFGVVAPICALSVVITYVALIGFAMFSGAPLTIPHGSIHLPFLHDWNVIFMFVVSLPTVVALTLLDQTALANALARVQADEIISVNAADARDLQRHWENLFGRVNRVAQVIGCTIGIVVAFANYWAYSQPRVGFWIALDGRMLPVGWYFLFCLWLFYAVVTFYIIRTISVSLFLASLVRQGHIRMLPFHPDHCGGLRPVGRLGLRNQYGLTVFGINVVLFLLTARAYQALPPVHALIAVTIVGYLVVGPLVFLGPLAPFRSGMVRTKGDLLGEVAARLRLELQRLRKEISHGVITREDEELIDRLRKIGSVIDELPVWPFDSGTLLRFVTAYLLPLLSAVAYPIGRYIFDIVLKHG